MFVAYFDIHEPPGSVTRFTLRTAYFDMSYLFFPMLVAMWQGICWR